VTEPRQPQRTRLVRPDLFRDETTGTLRPAQLVLYLGLATVADDEGWLLWQPASIAAVLAPYAAPGRRVRDLERNADVLASVDLLRVLPCGCAVLPRSKRDLTISGGKQSRQVLAYHQAHITDQSVALPDDPAYLSSSSSDSLSGLSSSSSFVDVAREAEPTANGHTKPGGIGRPFDGMKTTKTMVTNEDLPAHLRVVQVPR
jgi:hypothetical protein